MLRLRRKPEPVEQAPAWLVFDDTVVAPDAVVAPPLTPQERETARIVAEQKRAADGGRRAEAMEREAKAAWEANRPGEPIGFDRSGFVY